MERRGPHQCGQGCQVQPLTREYVPHLGISRVSNSDLVCLTFEECNVKWNYLEEQRAKRRTQETAARVAVPAPAAQSAFDPANFQQLLDLAKAMAGNNGQGPITSKAVHAAAPASKQAKRKKSSNVSFCILFNTVAGCPAVPTWRKGCIRDGQKYRHGCFTRLADGRMCNKMEHNMHSHT